MVYRAEWELETITPLFMSGADQRNVEIRSSSIKGVIRWWFRALAGNCAGNNIEKLVKMEKQVFGWQDKKSPVKITIETNSSPKPIFFKPRKYDKDSYISELGYLWFSIKISANKGDIVYFYPPHTKLKVMMSSLDDDILNKAVVTLWTAVTLGGFGFRSRRGAGNLRIVSNFDHTDLPSKFDQSSVIENIRRGIKRAVEVICSDHDVLNLVEKPVYPILSQQYSCVSLIKPFRSHPVETLKNFQREYSSFRKNPKYREKRIIFGLPIVNKNSKLGRVKNAAKKARRASPMIMKVIPIENMYGLLISKFVTKPFYKGEMENDINDVADWNVLYNFDKQLQEDIIWGMRGVFKCVIPFGLSS